MIPETITISSRIDTKAFSRFAVFDTFTRQKRWRQPALFSGIMLVFACICYSMHSRAEQAFLLGHVLLGIGIVLPAVYFGNFFYSLRAQAKKLKLDAPKHVYTVVLTDAADGVTVTTPTKEGGTLRLDWNRLYFAYRVPGCIYLFVSAKQAFLLPDDQANVTPDELWDFIKEKLSSEKWKDCRRSV